MAFVLPTFNILVDIYGAGLPPPAGPPRATAVPAQLRAPAANNIVIVSVASANSAMVLLIAPLTDIRDGFNAPINSSDWIEAPAGTGRFYRVVFVDDIGKGFPNEHRFAILQKVLAVPWPTRIP
jgi:hypothetical protein